jgi:hypothetical protein
MATYTRKEFLERMLLAGAGWTMLGGSGSLVSAGRQEELNMESLKVFIPMPLQVVIDDVGWWSGEDGSSRQEPYRTGINRSHVPADYEAIADLGRALGIRPQAAFILCEWDRENILRKLPTSTWMGEGWDNSRWIGPWLEEAAEIIRQNQEHFEITIHGIGHEYWEDGRFTRAEWTDSNGRMRPVDQVELHLEYFEKLMDQHDLGPFPKSFVPTAFRHSFGPSDGRDISLAEILKRWGVNYINTPFKSIHHRDRIQYEYFGMDSGVITIDRGEDEFPWLTFPADPSAEIKGPTCGMHWPNMLHPLPERNSEIVERWVKHLKPYDDRPDRMLARDSVVFQHQLINHCLTKTRCNGQSIELDFRETDRLEGMDISKELTVKVLSETPREFRAQDISIQSQQLKTTSGFLYELNLERKEGYSKAWLNCFQMENRTFRDIDVL